MPNLPTTFSDELTPITAAEVVTFDTAAAAAIDELSAQGLVVLAGLRLDDVPALTTIAGEPGVCEYCPKDLTIRWGDEAMARAELLKDGGHAVFQLREPATDSLAGYGWVRAINEQELTLMPDCQHIFAIRLSANFRGRHLATPFIRAIVAGAELLYGATNIGFETWDSNIAAIKADVRAGAVEVNRRQTHRPTLIPENQDADGNCPDTRLYMQFSQSMR